MLRNFVCSIFTHLLLESLFLAQVQENYQASVLFGLPMANKVSNTIPFFSFVVLSILNKHYIGSVSLAMERYTHFFVSKKKGSIIFIICVTFLLLNISLRPRKKSRHHFDGSSTIRMRCAQKSLQLSINDTYRKDNLLLCLLNHFSRVC